MKQAQPFPRYHQLLPLISALLLVGLLSAGVPLRAQPASSQPLAPPPTVCPAPAPEDLSGAVLFGNGTPGSCTQAALQSLLNAGGTIRCNCGPQPFTLVLTATLTVPNRRVVLDGQDRLTLSGNNAVRIFDKLPAANQAQGSFFGLQNLTLLDGRASLAPNDRGGGAILGRAFGSMKVLNVTFRNNQGPLSASDDCGAVHTILYKDVVFANCTFTGNKGANGGAVGTIGSAQQFINCVFEDNQATGTGGTFALGGSGGAVYVDGVDQNGVTNTMSLCGCTFRRNTAGYQAGALNIIFYAGQGSSGRVDRCTFEDNTCAEDKGGAYYHMNGPLQLTNSTFARNRSPALGGGVWLSNTLLSASNCTFAANEAVGSGGAGLGGGLAIDGSGTEKAAAVTNCTFAGNRAGNFASAIMNTGNLTLVNSLFQNNLTGTGFQSNPYGGGTINKNSNLTVGAGNLQFPRTYNAQFGPQVEDWLTPAVLVADAQLGPLANNGGPTPTQALPATSPARDAGTSTGAPATDQRGQVRLGNVDSGAFEYNSTPLPVTLARLAPAAGLAVFPTVAADGYVRYQFTGPVAADAQLVVTSLTGRHVATLRGGAAGGLPVRGLAAGWYVVQLTTGTSRYSARFYKP